MAYCPQSLDTTVEADRVQFHVWRSMRPDERLRRIGELCASARFWTEVGLRQRYPDADEREIRMRLFATWLDRDTMVRCYGWDPREH